MTAQEKIANKVAAIKIADLQVMAEALVADMRDEAGIVLSAVLNALMNKMPEADFVAFCEKLEA